MPRKKRERGAESTVTAGGRGSPVRRKTKVMSTVQASDRDAALWDMRFAKAEMGGEIETESVGSLYDDDPTGCKPSRSQEASARLARPPARARGAVTMLRTASASAPMVIDYE